MSNEQPKWTEIEHLPEWDEDFYEVYTAKKHGKWVMLKTLRPELRDKPEYREMIEKEFDVRYNLAHPSIIMINDFEEVPGLGMCIITDDVYGTFVPHYRSLLADLPYNTASVYSFSKYFGATGWRLAVIATAPKNVFDDRIAALPADKKQALVKRYACLTDHIESVKFTDRMVADSRLVALNGTAGLGTPQQVMMSLFALYCLLDTEDAYRAEMQRLVQGRLGLLWKSLGWTLEPDPLRAGYYSVIDLEIWATRLYGADFFAWLKKNYDSLDIVVRLARDTGVVLMDGAGFDAPEWSVRVSLANLNADDYAAIGAAIGAMLDDYAQAWKAETAQS